MHPYHEHRAHKHEKSRVKHILGRAQGGGATIFRARGGAVGGEEDSEFETDREIAGKHVRRGSAAKAHLDGKRSKHRLDRKAGGRARHGDEREDAALVKHMVKPESLKHRAKGGRAGKGKGKTVVNVIVGRGQQQDHAMGGAPMPPSTMGARPPMPPPPAAGPPPGLVPPPPGGMAPPGMPSPGGPPPGLGARPPMMPPPPGMPPRAKGGRIGVRNQGPGDKMPQQPPGWAESARTKTPVQHTDGKTTGRDIGRGKPVTYARGGAAGNRPVQPLPAPSPGPGGVGGTGKASSRAIGYRGQPKTGSGGGLARLEKARSGVL